MRVPINQIGKSTKQKWQTTSDIKSDESKPVTSGRFERIFCAVIISLIFAIVAILASLIAASVNLSHLFHDAGLPWPANQVEVPVGGEPDSFIYRWLGETLRSLLPHN